MLQGKQQVALGSQAIERYKALIYRELQPLVMLFPITARTSGENRAFHIYITYLYNTKLFLAGCITHIRSNIHQWEIFQFFEGLPKSVRMGWMQRKLAIF
jgi:hypothetical protein